MVTLDENLASVSRRKLAELAMDASARNVVAYSKMLLSALGKEKAMEVIYKQRFDDSFKIGKRNGERLGEKAKELATMADPGKKTFVQPFVTPSEVVELTETRYVSRTTGCLMGEAILRMNLDDDLMDLAKLWCTHDFGRMAGYNPDIKFTRTKFIMDGDSCCEFIAEIEK